VRFRKTLYIFINPNTTGEQILKQSRYLAAWLWLIIEFFLKEGVQFDFTDPGDRRDSEEHDFIRQTLCGVPWSIPVSTKSITAVRGFTHAVSSPKP
jgi:hypothetical protein